MHPYELPSLHAVRVAAQLISDVVLKTPTKASLQLTSLANQKLQRNGISEPIPQVELLLKCENFQRTGSFKFRGAYHFIAKLTNDELKNGVVAYSTGNHAQAVAHAAQLASQNRNISVPAYVVVPSDCPHKKISAAEAHGATVIFSGPNPNDRVILAEQVQSATGAVLIPPADDQNIVLGQATAVQEFVQQANQMGRNLDAIIVPSGGGGLLCGAIAVCKPRGIAVFGAEPESGGPSLAHALQTGRRTLEIEHPGSIADGLRSLTGEANWEHIKFEGNVQDVLTVSEAQIKEALRIGVQGLGFAIEPSAAVPLAAVLFGHPFRDWVESLNKRIEVGVILTGGNVSMKDLVALVPELNVTKGRI